MVAKRTGSLPIGHFASDMTACARLRIDYDHFLVRFALVSVVR
jgi:hypothetical protein